MRLRANMSGVDKCFDRRGRAVEAKKPEKNGEKNGEVLNKWTGAGEGVLGAENYMSKGKEEGMVVGSPLVREKAGLAGTKDLGLKSKIALMNESTEAQSRNYQVPLQPLVNPIH